MQLTLSEIKDRLAADFGGSLVFQPLGGEETAVRPVARLASVAQLLPRSADFRALSEQRDAPSFSDFLEPPATRHGKGAA